MKIFKEFALILIITFIGEFISKVFSLSLPGSVIGMLFLLALLLTKIIRLEQIELVSNFFLDNLAFFFLPAGVGIISAFSLLKGNTFKIIFIIVISTLVVLITTALTIELSIKILSKKDK